MMRKFFSAGRRLDTSRSFKLVIVFGASIIFWSCAPSVYFVRPSDWDTPGKQDSTISYYSDYLKGEKIFLDPGHGGVDRWGHGPTGETEADINLRVGLALRDYLTRAGAIVFMSRTKDTTVSLLDRPKLAAESGADIFISIHHNATGGSEKYPPLNYTSTWYHAFEGDSAYTPADHDLARYVERDLAYAMGNPGPDFFSFDGTLSDYLVYPFAGFAVLRHSKMPAILTECSFFTSPYEERRLTLDTFNEIEAWGIFKGLGKYFQAGIPGLLYTGDTVFTQTPIKFEVNYSEGKFVGGKYAIDKNYLQVELDGKPIAARFNDNSDPTDSSDGIVFTAADLLPGRHYFSVIIRNEEGNHSFPFLKYFTYVPPAATISASVFPDTLSAKSSEFYTRAVVSSKEGCDISDFVNLSIVPTNATVDTTFHSKGAIYTVFKKVASDKIVVKYLLDTLETTLTPPTSDNISTASVSISSSNGSSLENATIWSNDKKISSSLSNGFAVFDYADAPLTISLPGYYLKEIDTLPQTPVRLTPIADSVVIGKTILIDPAYGGSESGPISGSLRAADIDLIVAKRLNELLQSFGANSRLVRDTDTTLTVEQRAAFSKNFSRGFYIVISASNAALKFSFTIYPSIENRKLAADLQNALNIEYNTSGIAASRRGIFELAALNTLAIEIPSPEANFYSEENLQQQASEIAWRILDGMLNYYGYLKTPSRSDYTQLEDALRLPDRGTLRTSEGYALFINPSQLKLINRQFLSDYKKGNEEK